jgi:hypothetical protein
MSDTSAYELRNRPCGKAFAKAWDIALEAMLDRVEQCAVERSINGVARPIFYKGEQVGEWRHHDERLTMFLLRGRRARRYGKWADHPNVPPPEPDVHAHVRLADALGDIAMRAPDRDGNELDDWSPEDDSEA